MDKQTIKNHKAFYIQYIHLYWCFVAKPTDQQIFRDVLGKAQFGFRLYPLIIAFCTNKIRYHFHFLKKNFGEGRKSFKKILRS